ncbi:MAG: sigma-70 family RNA polymerase sigma factor [Planctomycetota bacterium]
MNQAASPIGDPDDRSQVTDSLATSTSLLARADAGDASAWSQVVQLYGPLVYAWARKSGLSSEDAADTLQETMLAVSEGLSRYDKNRPGSTFRGWLRQITRNKCVDLFRRSAMLPANARGGSTNMMRLNEDALDAELNSAKPETLAAERRQVVQRALAIMRNHFERSTWQAFWRTAIDGCRPDDVAEELGMSRWNVYKARSRVLQRLRTELDGLEDLD